MSIQKVAIIGLGAMGIMYGHHLAKRMKESDLLIIADEARIERYRRDHLYCNGERCQFQYVTPDADVGPVDLVLFTVKFHQLPEAIQAVRNFVGPKTLLLSALNGIESEEMIGAAYGMENVVYCVAQGMDPLREENRVSYEHMGILVIGDPTPGHISPNVKRLAAFFDRVDLPYEIETHMKKRMWGKFMLNVGVNQTVAVYRGNFGMVQQAGEAREKMIAAMREVLNLAPKEGVDLTEEDLTYWLSVLDTLNPAGKPSLAQDVEAGRPTEVDMFSGTVIALGKKHGVPTPVNEELYTRIKEIENKD
ncbi:MAG: ketopantoate reductase family protein [Candidatus Carbobacillus altaicus]|nr:ketopantoate reductase family protein [Candidatus Carbobacillus altaicus]